MSEEKIKCLHENCVNEVFAYGICQQCFNQWYYQSYIRVNAHGWICKGRKSKFKHDYENPIHSNYDLIHDFNSIGPGNKLKGWEE